MSKELTAPALLDAEHLVMNFDSGEPSLDEWLKRRALKNQAKGGARCFVTCLGKEVVGYYSLSAAVVAHEAAPKALRRNMPDPIPALLLGRLAVSKNCQNRGIGKGLLRDAMLRAARVSTDAGVSLILLHALSMSAKSFYISQGFVESPIQPMTLMMTLQTVRQILSELE